MFETSQEVLILLLVGLGAALTIIVVLILRKQRQIKSLQEVDAVPAEHPEENKPPEEGAKPPEESAKTPEEAAKAPEEAADGEGGLQYAFADEGEGSEDEQAPRPEQADTGPTDIESIKASIVPGAAKPPPGIPGTEKPEADEKQKLPFGEEDAQPAVESGVEEGVELDQAGAMMEPFPAEKAEEAPSEEDAQPSGELPVEEKPPEEVKPPASEPEPEEEIRYVDLDSYEESMDEQAEKAGKPADAGSMEEEIKRAQSMKPEERAKAPSMKDEEKYGPPNEDDTDTLASSPAEEGPEPAQAPFAENEEEPSFPEPPEVKEPEPVPSLPNEDEEGPEPVQLPADEDGQAAAPAPGKSKKQQRPRKPMDTSAALSMITSADLAQSPNDYIGKSVSMEGIIKLSSRGKKDVWYVLFDDTGSAVVRSGEDIPIDKVRVFAEIKETKLGQTYLDVLKYEKA